MPPAPMAALEASGPHQPGDPFAAHVDVQAQAQLGGHARGAIGAAAAGMELADLLGERSVGQRADRGGTRAPGVIAGACHTQHAGQTGDSVVGFLLIDQLVAAHR
jgi:hypothetical protein